MKDIRDGYIAISDQCTIYPGFSFAQFQQTKFYRDQDGIKMIYLDGPQRIHGRNYMVSLFFRREKIYLVSLTCCDREFAEREEQKRKQFHDAILKELGLRPQERYSWGEIVSTYDPRSNLSSINLVYLH